MSIYSAASPNFLSFSQENRELFCPSSADSLFQSDSNPFSDQSSQIFTSAPLSPFALQPLPTAPITQPTESKNATEALISILSRLKEHTSQLELKNTYYIDDETNEAFLTDVFQFVPLCAHAEAEIKASKIAFEPAYHMLLENFLHIFIQWKLQADTFTVSPLPRVCDLIFNHLDKFSLSFCAFIDAAIQFDHKNLIFTRETPDQTGIRNLFWKKNWSGVVNKLKQLPKIPDRFEELGLISELFARNVRWQELAPEQISLEVKNCYYYPFVATCQSSDAEVVQLLKGNIPTHFSSSKNLWNLRVALLLKNGAHGNQPVRTMLLNEWRQAAFKHLERADLELKGNTGLTLGTSDLEITRPGEKRPREEEEMTLEQEGPPNKISNFMSFFSMDTDGDVF